MTENKFIVEGIIEMSKHSRYKYEIDKNTDELTLDRVLNQEIPHNYGFIPDTLCDDGDALDLFVISKEPIYPKTTVKVNIIGAFKCNDNGDDDDKLLGIILGEETLHDIEAAKWQIRQYLSSYKKGFKVESFLDTKDAEGIYNWSM